LSRTLYRLAILALLAALAGCDEANWGDLASNFVDSEVPSLSRNYASAHLTEVWNQSLVEADANAVVASKELADQIEEPADVRVDDLNGLSAAVLLDRFNQADALVGHMITTGIQVQELEAQSRSPESICGDRALFFSRGLGAVGVIGPFSAIAPSLGGQRGAWTIGVSFTIDTDDGSGNNGQGGTSGNEILQSFVQAAQVVGDLFSKSQTEQQNETLDDAIARLPQRALQPDYAFALSQQVCSDAATSEADLHNEATAAVGTLSPLLTSRLHNAVLRRNLIASYLRPLELQQFLMSTGVAAELTTMQQEVIDGEVSTQVEVLLKSVQRSAEIFVAQTQCMPKLQASEDLEDAAAEARAQLTVFKGAVSAKDDVDRIQSAIVTMTKIKNEMPGLRKSASESLCK